MSGPAVIWKLCMGPCAGGWATLELALISRLRLMGLGLAICPSHTEVPPSPARAWHSWFIWRTILLRSPARLWCRLPAMDSGMVEVDTVTLGGASASGNLRGPNGPTVGC